MTDSSSIQGSTSSGSSDLASLNGGSGGGGGSNSGGLIGRRRDDIINDIGLIDDCGVGTEESNSDRSAGSSNRIRIIRLCRPNLLHNSNRSLISNNRPQNSAFGFAIRGGREFGIGFFVSRVENGSEADIRGLRVGDKIIRVNGYLVDDAVHKELSQYMSSQDRLTLKVRGVGMLPIKDRSIDPLTWHIVPLRMTPTQKLDDLVCQNVRIVLTVDPRTKLGLGICKGPEWKPGIFVQFTKEGGIAREAGLRPGDQLLSCNNIDFSDVLFSEAVAVMKSSFRLEMIVRTAAGLDLFPGESSGYNSSASSITGDQSPCWDDQASKRLSIVREEDGSEKVSQIRPKNWERKELDRRKERRLHMVEPPIIPDSYHHNQNYQPPNNNRNYSISTSPIPPPTSFASGIINPTTTHDQLTNTSYDYHNNYINNDKINNNNNNINNNNQTKNNNANKTIIKLTENETVINNTIIPTAIINRQQTPYPSIPLQATKVNLDNSMPINGKYNQNNNNNNNLCVNITNNGSDSSGGKLNELPTQDQYLITRKNDLKTITADVHRNPVPITTATTTTSTTKTANIDRVEKGKITNIAPPPPPPIPGSSTELSLSSSSSTLNGRHSSLSSSMSIPSSLDASSLSSAITDELKKRAQKFNYDENGNCNHPPLTQPNEKPTFLLKKVRSAIGGGGQNIDKHTALIDEFKMAHKKMFKGGFIESIHNENGGDRGGSDGVSGVDTERRLEMREAIERDETDLAYKAIHAKTPGSPILQNGNSDYANNNRQPPTPIPDYETSLPMQKSAALNSKLHPNKNGNSNNNVNNNNYNIVTGNNGVDSLKGTMGRCAAQEIAKANGNAAELESIDSYKLTNPASPPPKPPSLYFHNQSTGPATLKKPLRSVSVTIGEYTGRKELPSKFNFISKNGNTTTTDGNSSFTSISAPQSASAELLPSHQNGNSVNFNNENITNLLQNELQKTLNRSNLKAKNDEIISNNLNYNENQSIINQNGQQQQHPPPPPPPLHHNLINASTNENTKPLLHKTQSNVEKITAMLVSQNLMGSSNNNLMNGNGGNGNNNKVPSAITGGQQQQQQNRVTIMIPNGNNNITNNKPQLKKVESTPTINGILKNGNGNHNGHNGTSATITSNGNLNNGGTEHKNISFGKITTVVTEN